MKYKHLVFLSFLFIVALLPLSAQRIPFNIDDFKKKKAEYIIKEAGLTSADAKVYIPLSNELLDKRFELNRTIRSKNRQLREKQRKTDADYIQMIENSFDLQAKELELEKEYYLKFKQVLSPEKLYKSQRAETKFMKEAFNKNDLKGRQLKK